jgi:hypothetical protein
MAEKTQVFQNRHFRDFGGFFVLLLVFNIKKKQSNLETKTCTLIWYTNPRSPPSFSPIGLRMAEKFEFFVRETTTTTTTTTTTDT